MSCPDLAIPGVDGILYLRLVQTALRAGISKDDNDRWHVPTKLGQVEVSVRYDIPSSTLHLICSKKPFLLSCHMVAEKVRELIQSAKEAA